MYVRITAVELTFPIDVPSCYFSVHQHLDSSLPLGGVYHVLVITGVKIRIHDLKIADCHHLPTPIDTTKWDQQWPNILLNRLASFVTCMFPLLIVHTTCSTILVGNGQEGCSRLNQISDLVQRNNQE